MTDSGAPHDSDPPGEPAAAGPEREHTGEPPARPSGLRNPQAAVRGVGAGALCIEALVLLLAIVPVHVLGVRHVGVAIGCIAALAGLCIVVAGMLRRAWAWWVGLALQVVLLGYGYFHVVLTIVGVMFLLLWLYVLNVRRTVLGGRAN